MIVAGYYGGWLDNINYANNGYDARDAQYPPGNGHCYHLGAEPDKMRLLPSRLFTSPQYARILRASVLTIREQDYVTAAHAIGVNDFRILTRAILPNCLAPLIVQGNTGDGCSHFGCCRSQFSLDLVLKLASRSGVQCLMRTGR